MYQNWYFGFEKKPSGNPVHDRTGTFFSLFR
jgi:hypothetical protein